MSLIKTGDSAQDYSEVVEMHVPVAIGLVSLLALFVVSNGAQAEMFIFPEKGQSKDQQELDQFTCYKWAKEQTGIDPNQVSVAAAPPPPESGQVAKGAARGGSGCHWWRHWRRRRKRGGRRGGGWRRGGSG